MEAFNDRELARAVDEFYVREDALTLAALNKLVQKPEQSSREKFWLQRQRDAQKALEYATEQLNRLE